MEQSRIRDSDRRSMLSHGMDESPSQDHILRLTRKEGPDTLHKMVMTQFTKFIFFLC